MIPSEPRSVEDTFGRVREHWFDPQAEWSWSRPAIVGGVVIFATGDARLVARDRATGTARWSTSVTSVNGVGLVGGRDLVAARGVVVAAISRNVVGVDIATGRELWSYGAPADTIAGEPGTKPATLARASLATDGESVYVPAWGASVSAVDLRAGKPRWVWRSWHDAGEVSGGTPQTLRAGAEGVTVSGDTVLVSGWSNLNGPGTRAAGWLRALDRHTGQELWHVTFPDTSSGTVVCGRPALWGNLGIVAAQGGLLYAVDRTTQRVVWRYRPTEFRSMTAAAPAVYGDVVYGDGGDEHTIALRAKDGSVVWRTMTVNIASTDLLVTDRRVYVPSDMFLNILDRETGRFIARVRQHGATYASPGLFASPGAAADGQVFFTVARGAWSFDEP